ncbi:uncharacterized protein V3H82_023836 [Fundulus diaphanus]
MNGAAVLFVERVEQANLLVESGISVNGSFLQVSPLTQPATRVILSNVPPFISDEFLVKELSRHGKVVSPVKKILSGCKSPLLKHVVSHRRQLFMILSNRDEELNLRFRVRVDEFDYVLFATSSGMKCFGCGQEGHLIKSCPNRAGAAPSSSAEQQPAAAGEQVGVSGKAGAPAAVEESGAAGNSSVAAEEAVASAPVAGDRQESLVEEKNVDETSDPQRSDCVVSEGSTVVCGGGETCVTGEEVENQGEMEQDGECEEQEEETGVCGEQGGKGDVVAGGGEVSVEESVVAPMVESVEEPVVVCGGGETCVTGEEVENQGEMEQDGECEEQEEETGVCGEQGRKGDVVAGGGEVSVVESVVAPMVESVEEPVVAPVEEKGEGEQVMGQEAPMNLKRRSKRKNVVTAVQSSKQVSRLTTERKELSDSSEVSLSQGSSAEARYPVESFNSFLQETKGLRGIKGGGKTHHDL